MLRKRDFILYMLVLGFLVLGTSYTAIFGQSAAGQSQLAALPAQELANSLIASREPNVTARTERIAELKEKLAAGAGRVDGAPPVLTSVDSPPAPLQASGTEMTDPQSATEERLAQYCGAMAPNQIVNGWPAGVHIDTNAEGRTVFYERTTMQSVGSSTQPLVEKVDLITLPVRDIRSTFDTCLPDTTIGITAAGLPLDNRLAGNYAGYGSGEIIGYARDGFPILGPVPDQSGLDACGGFYNGFSYEYHIRPDEPFILGCYASLPADFN